MMRLDAMRVRTVVRKELRDFRRRRSIVVTMVVLPLVFLIEPIVTVFVAPAPSAGLDNYVVLPILYLLLVPVIMPSILAAYSVVGEREQGTLEPLLTTPLRRQEFIVGKAAAILIPSLALSYVLFGLFLAAIALFAEPALASAVFHQGSLLLTLFVMAPLLAGWAIVVGMVISVRATEVRVAQQLGTLASFPPLGAILALAVGVIHPTLMVALAFAGGLVVLDLAALRLAAGTFDPERLITGAKASRAKGGSRRAGRPAAQSQVSDAPLSDQERPTMATAMLELRRKTGGVVYRHTPFDISIDGEVVGSVSNNQTVELPLVPGHHSLRMGSGRRISPARSFDAADGEVVSFSCRCAMFWPQWAAALIIPSLWISLRRD